MAKTPKGAVIVVQPDEGRSFWQPVPANGYAEMHVSKDRDSRIEGFSSGIQIIAPGCHIREHRHGVEQELLFFFEGTGKVLVNGVEHPVPAVLRRPTTARNNVAARPLCPRITEPAPRNSAGYF